MACLPSPPHGGRSLSTGKVRRLALQAHPQHPGIAHYRVSNAYNDMCLDVAWFATNNWAQVVQAGCTGTDNQLWKRERAWDGSEFLRPRHTNKCLDISWGWAIQYECNGSGNQR